MTVPDSDGGAEHRMYRSRGVWLGLILVLLTGLIALGLFWKPHRVNSDAVSLPPDPSCDLHAGPCTLVLPGRALLRFAIEPRDIPLLKPLRIKVDLDGVEARAVSVEITGRNMDMGFDRVQLLELGAGHFAGDAVLPICSSRRMEWRAMVVLDLRGRGIAAPFDFHTVRH